MLNYAKISFSVPYLLAQAAHPISTLPDVRLTTRVLIWPWALWNKTNS